MSLGTGAIKSWWGSCENTGYRSCRRYHANPVSRNHPVTSTIKQNELQLRYSPNPILTMTWLLGGVGRAGHLIDKIGGQSNDQWRKQTANNYGEQSSDLQRSAEQSTGNNLWWLLSSPTSTSQGKSLAGHAANHQQSRRLLHTLAGDWL